MKKKDLKKLTLSRETLRTLDEDWLRDVAGEAIVSTQYSRCNQSCGIACTVITCRNCEES